MSITINCPTCGAELELHDFAAGDVVECPGCGQSFIPDLPEVNEKPQEEVAPMGILKRKPLRIPKDTMTKTETPPPAETEQVKLLRKLVGYARLWTIVFIYIPAICSIIALIATIFIGIRNEGLRQKAQVQAAQVSITRTHISQIADAVQEWERSHHFKKPDSLDRILLNGQPRFTAKDKIDSWGNEIQYQLKEDGVLAELRSAGPDGQMNTIDDIVRLL